MSLRRNRRIRVITFNNQGFPKRGRKRVKWNFAIARNAGADLYCIQESWHLMYLRVLNQVFRAEHWARWASIKATGAVVLHRRSRFRRIHKFTKPLHRAVVFPTKGVVCGRRTFSGEILHVLGTTHKVAYASAHFTPGRNNKKRFNDRQRAKIATIWAEGADELKEWMTKQAGWGRTVIVGMDANATLDQVRHFFGSKIAGRRVRYLVSPDTGIDYVMVVGEVEVVDHEVIRGQYSDHPPYKVTIELPAD